MYTHTLYKFLYTTLIFSTISGLGLQTTAQQLREYASESVLATGEWYKIGIVNSGVYKIDRAFLSQMGVDITQIDPRNIQIYGNGGGMLPQANSAFRYDDLQQNAIIVHGEEDGVFDAGDDILFYGEGPHVWTLNKEEDRFEHQYHLYSDTSFYFLTVGQTQGLRVSDMVSGAATREGLSGRRTYFHELDRELPVRSGRFWLGEKFDLIDSYSFSFPAQHLSAEGKVRMKIRVAARSGVVTKFRVFVNEEFVGDISVSATNVNSNESIYYNSKIANFSLLPDNVRGDSLIVRLEYDKSGFIRSEGWLDYIELDYDHNWDVAGNDQAIFYLTQGTREGSISRLNIANGSQEHQVWDITNPLTPLNLPFDVSSNSLMTLSVPGDTLRRLMVFDGNGLFPVSGRKISNQNLHGTDLVEYIVVTPPSLLTQAQRLADFHQSHYGQSYVVVTPEQIYNEFSSGMQDVSAIRDFIKMIYDQSGGTLPTSVVMFGDGTYDYKGHIKDINNQPIALGLLPTYQSRNSWSPTQSYTSDDFFTFLDDDEGFWGERSGIDGDISVDTDLMDTGVGRLPVESVEEAEIIVDKIIRYVTGEDSKGAWRNRVVLVADHKEGDRGIHVVQADGYTDIIEESDECINLEKIYMDNYTLVPTPTNPAFPDGREALLNELDKGSLIVNYTGHGGEFAWSNSRIFENGDISSINNDFRLPAIVTATCEYGRFDESSLPKSGAELMILEENGGAIALYTTVRLVYSSPNAELNANFYREVFTFDENAQRMPLLGEVMARTKNRTYPRNTGSNINSRNFTLLGDPGIQLAYPNLRAQLTTINGRPIEENSLDSLASLSTIELGGVITDPLGNPIDAYNGSLEVTVFDKPSTFTTRLSRFTFDWRKNKIFNGTALVQNGAFSFKFVVPIDVSYDEGSGKMSLYFANEEVDGAGCYTNFFVGGTDPNAIIDNVGPEIDLFINDSSFVDGGTTGKDPTLLAMVSDQSGINTVGSGIGHEIIAIIDEDESQPIVLNDFYTANVGSYTEGTIRYQLKDLVPGPHTARIRVWDGANNPSESQVSFIVRENEELAIDQVRSVPNPAFSGDNIEFRIAHNQAGKDLLVELHIFTYTGQKVKTFSSSFNAEGYSFNDFVWDGTSELGVPVASGMYVYQVLVKDMISGRETNTYEKLVILAP